MSVKIAQTEAVAQDYFPNHEVDAVVFYGDPTRIYRARRRESGMPVMLKTLRNERAAREAAARLKHEYEVARRLDVPGVIRVFAMERHNNQPMIELEDFGGDSLDNIARQRRLSIEELLGIAIQLTQGLSEIHAANIIHKDINPSNIVYNPKTGVAKIIDFGISTYLTREQAALVSAEGFQGSLPYISPEQTGRMNRSIDYRSDFYSLGVTIYELLTGRTLFVVNEPIEWFHCHIAKKPIPPVEIDIKIPRPLSDLVMKLLAKTAEERYQSARGILADLQRCLDELRATGAIAPFDLGRFDQSQRFQIPQRLYGREKEVALLLADFDDAGRGECKMILVSGYSGIGKTCLIKEIYKPVTERRGHFVSGKFDQLHRNMPYSALAAALRDLVRQLLTESEEHLAQWRDKILEAVGDNGQLMIDIIRELELIVGAQPAVALAQPLEAEQRFHRVFQRFIQVFCRPEHPLVIFLDDLQWADSASMRLLDLLAGGASGITHLLVIGAYRDNEVNPGHPVAVWLKELRDRKVSLAEIQLTPLAREHLAQMLADTLGTDLAGVAALTEIVGEKTAGNPFFTEEFLKALSQEGLISFSRESGHWVWDVERIRARQMTDNVADLMTAKLKRLAPETRRLLELAACVGFRFPLSALAVVSEQPPADVARHLQAGIKEGLIAPIGDAYQLLELDHSADLSEVTVELAFAHDRIQQAAYALLDDEHRREAHLGIGRLLRQRLPESQQNDRLFEITNHLNLGSQLMEDPQERLALCRLNLSAGNQAKKANAYQLAYAYLKVALAFLEKDSWEKAYALTREIHLSAAEAAYLGGEYEAMDGLLEIGLARTVNLLDKVGFYLVQISACMARGQLPETIAVAKQVLHQLGHHYPAKPNQLHVLWSLIRLKGRLRNKRIEDLYRLPLMTDPIQLAAMSIGQRIGGAAMFAQPTLLPLMIFKGIDASLTYGHAPESLTTYPAFGMILAESLGDTKGGLAWGHMGIELTQRLQAKAIEGRVIHVHNALVRHWHDPIRDCLEPLRDAYHLCLENGDFEYAAHAEAVRVGNAFEAGVDLVQLFADVTTTLESLRPLKQGPRLHYMECFLQVIDNLMGNSPDPAKIQGRYYDIDVMLPMHIRSGDYSLATTDGAEQTYLYYMFGHYDEALKLRLTYRRKEAVGLQGMYFNVAWAMRDALVWLANVPGATGAKRRRLLREANVHLTRLKRWAGKNPANVQNKVRLVEAEFKRVAGCILEAQDLYDASIALARENGFLHEESLACERCGTMHVEAGRPLLGEPYLAKARDLYRRWGAQAKVADLEQRFAQIIEKTEHKKSGHTTTFSAPMSGIGISSLIKALKAIAEETVHSRMVEIIINTAMEFAGAQEGALILRNPGGVFCIEAEASVDGGNPRILQSIPVSSARLPQAVINYVSRTLSSIVIHDAQKPNDQIPGLQQDAYIQGQGVRSLLCLPILTGSRELSDLIGMLYLENNRASATFTQERFETLEIICLAAAGRLELSRKAVIDGLTQLYNHDYFQNFLAQEFSSARRHSRELAVVLIDIDHFKKFNDTWGHQVGDQVLSEVARIIKGSCRGGDTVARYGGEEMAVILPMTYGDKAQQVAERIRAAVEAHRVVHLNEKLQVTISVGLAVLDAGTGDKDALIRRADAALYRSKAEGRNKVSRG